MLFFAKKSFFARYCTIVTVLSPLLMMYDVGISTITFLDFAIILCYLGISLINLTRNKKICLNFEKINGLLIIYIFLILLNFIISSIYSTANIIGVFFRVLRFLLYVSWVLTIGKDYFVCKYALDLWKSMCIFATIYLILQYFALAVFNISIPGYLPFLKVSRPELITFTENLYFSASARPRSIFAEPSQYGIYLTGFLVVANLKKNYTLNKYVVVFLYIGMILSSSTAAFCGIFLSLLFLVYSSLREKRTIFTRKMCWILLLIMIVGVSIVVINWPTISEALMKILRRMPNSIDNRIKSIGLIIDEMSQHGFMHQFFGNGMDADLINSLGWTSSVVKIFFYYGYFGFAVFILGQLYVILRYDINTNIFLFTMILLGCFTELLMSNWLVLYLPFIKYINRKLQ